MAEKDWRLDHLDMTELFRSGVHFAEWVKDEYHHEHCAFCFKEISCYEGCLREGYCTDDDWWICPRCYNDFKAIFDRWDKMRGLSNFNDFVNILTEAGFSQASGDGKDNVFSIVNFGWNNAPADGAIKWHTGDPETDPWEWRVRAVTERNDIAYGKLFFNKAGYITREWYPYFLAVRRGGRSFEEYYADGLATAMERRVFEAVEASGRDGLATHEIKPAMGGIAKNDRSAFERALTALQSRLFITACGVKRKISSEGEEYGWGSMTFCKPEEFFGEGISDEAAKIGAAEAFERVKTRVSELNPYADAKKIEKFIRG